MLDTSSVHVNFLSYQTSKLVSEELLRTIFSAFGDVKDVIIKKSTKDHNIQRGYGFVHYSNTAEGIQSTLTAIANMYDVTIDNVNFTCAMSHACEQGFLSSGSPFPASAVAASPPSSLHSGHTSRKSSPYPTGMPMEGYFVPVPPANTPSGASASAAALHPLAAPASGAAYYGAAAPSDPHGQYYMMSHDHSYSDPNAAYVGYPQGHSSAAYYGSSNDMAYIATAAPGGYHYMYSTAQMDHHQQQQQPQYFQHGPTPPHHAVMQHQHQQQTQSGAYFAAPTVSQPFQVRGYVPQQHQQVQQPPNHNQQFHHYQQRPLPQTPTQRHSAPRSYYSGGSRPHPLTLSGVGRSHSDSRVGSPAVKHLAARQYHSAQELSPPPTPTAGSKQSSPPEENRSLAAITVEVPPVQQRQEEVHSVATVSP